jgi:hypothetical protein
VTGDSEKIVPAAFYRNKNGSEPVLEWLRNSSSEDRKAIGSDIKTVEFG